jgi:hypothetical protein
MLEQLLAVARDFDRGRQHWVLGSRRHLLRDDRLLADWSRLHPGGLLRGRLLRDCGLLLMRGGRGWLNQRGMCGRRRTDGLLRGRLLRGCRWLLARRGGGWLTRRSVRGWRRRSGWLLHHRALWHSGLLHRWPDRRLGWLLSGRPLRGCLLLHGGMRGARRRLLHGRALWRGRRLLRAWLRRLLLLLLLLLPGLLMPLVLSVGFLLLLRHHDGAVGRCRDAGHRQPQDGDYRRGEKEPVGLVHSYPSLERVNPGHLGAATGFARTMHQAAAPTCWQRGKTMTSVPFSPRTRI